MHRAKSTLSLMKRIPLIAAVLFAFALSPLEADLPLSSFDFDFGRLGEDEASQVKAVQSIGYSGLVLAVDRPKDLERLKRYQAAIGDGPFKVTAGLFTANFSRDLAMLNAHLDKVIQGLKKSNASLWLIPRDRKNVMKRVLAGRESRSSTRSLHPPAVRSNHYHLLGFASSAKCGEGSRRRVARRGRERVSAVRCMTRVPWRVWVPTHEKMKNG